MRARHHNDLPRIVSEPPASTEPAEPSASHETDEPNDPNAPSDPGDLSYPDSAEAETILYPCGTIAVGQYEPCAHSSIQVLCCTCAGCAADVWDCGRTRPRPSWAKYEASYIAAVFGTNAGLWMIALAVIVFFCSHIPEWILYILFVIFVLSVTGLILISYHSVQFMGNLVGL